MVALTFSCTSAGQIYHLFWLCGNQTSIAKWKHRKLWPLTLSIVDDGDVPKNVFQKFRTGTIQNLRPEKSGKTSVAQALFFSGLFSPQTTWPVEQKDKSKLWFSEALRVQKITCRILIGSMSVQRQIVYPQYSPRVSTVCGLMQCEGHLWVSICLVCYMYQHDFMPSGKTCLFSCFSWCHFNIRNCPLGKRINTGRSRCDKFDQSTSHLSGMSFFSTCRLSSGTWEKNV